jgi:hypothetical protein
MRAAQAPHAGHKTRTAVSPPSTCLRRRPGRRLRVVRRKEPARHPPPARRQPGGYTTTPTDTLHAT